VIIGEQKFSVELDSKESRAMYDLAAEYGVPILLHFQQGAYNLGYERFGDILAKYPKTIFIGHAQTMWAHIDKNYDFKRDGIYPKGPVTPGGLTDRYLADHPNFFTDMSAGSGLNAILRDEEFSRGFLKRHQDKLLYGSDCADKEGQGPKCSGAGMLTAIRHLAPDKAAVRKILYENSKKIFKLT
jgi:predicted TIM-barrel fold metal-dependent hydrolase